MSKLYDLDDFYEDKFGWKPDDLHKHLGHFGVFRIPEPSEQPPEPFPYQRRDFYKVSLVRGAGSVINYADKTVRIGRHALVFSDPLIPYNWEHLECIEGGFFCIFDREFFSQFGGIDRYSVFRPDGMHVFELTEEQMERVTHIYERMLEEKASHYEYKEDVLRTLTFELLHLAMKLQPSVKGEAPVGNASQRILGLFTELLERQFPIDTQHGSLRLRTASEYAKQLNVHVNHLNRAIREQTGKTTTDLISERILQEAKILLKQTELTVAEIAYALSFSEATHFNAFFKRLTGTTPSAFRKAG